MGAACVPAKMAFCPHEHLRNSIRRPHWHEALNVHETGLLLLPLDASANRARLVCIQIADTRRLHTHARVRDAQCMTASRLTFRLFTAANQRR
jgi:hypothetical protein